MTKEKSGSRVSPSRESPKTKEAILAAALRTFASDGYHGASMPRIAKLANVGTPLIHYYFESKENLWRETVAYSLADLRRDALAIGSATRSLAPLDRLRVILQMVTQHAARCPDNFVMILAEARSDSDRFSWVHEHFTGVIFQEILLILQDARDKGEIRDIDIDQLASLLVGGVMVYFTANPVTLQKSEPKDIDRLATEYTDMMYSLLLNGAMSKTMSKT